MCDDHLPFWLNGLPNLRVEPAEESPRLGYPGP